MPTTFNPADLNHADASNGSLSLDQVNKAFRQSDVYKQWMTAHGKPTDGHASLTSSEEAGLGKTLELNGFPLPDGWHIDAGGNIAGDSHLARNLLIGAGIAAAAFGIPAVMGALGGGAAAGGTGAGLGGIESTATMGLADASGLGGAVAGVGGGAAGLGGAFDAAGNFIGGSTITDAGGTSGLGAASGGFGGILDTVGKVGGAISSIAGGLQQGRQQNTLDQQAQDRLAQDRYQSQLAAARLNLDAPGVREGQSVRGDILSNAKDFAYGAPTMVGNIPVPTSTGGLRPSIFSPATRALGSTIANQNLTNQNTNGGQVIAPPPPLTPIDQGGVGSSILGAVGNIAQFAPLLSPYLRPKTTQPQQNGGPF